MTGMELNYKEARELIKDGDIIFLLNDNTFNANVISFFTRSKYFHACLAFWINVAGMDRLMILEADASAKRRILNLSYYNKMNMEVFTGLKSWYEIAPEALKKVGTVEYKIFEAMWVGWREFCFKLFKIKLRQKDFEGEICSEMVARLEGLENCDVSPGALYDTLLRFGHKPKFKIII